MKAKCECEICVGPAEYLIPNTDMKFVTDETRWGFGHVSAASQVPANPEVCWNEGCTYTRIHALVHG